MDCFVSVNSTAQQRDGCHAWSKVFDLNRLTFQFSETLSHNTTALQMRISFRTFLIAVFSNLVYAVTSVGIARWIIYLLAGSHAPCSYGRHSVLYVFNQWSLSSAFYVHVALDFSANLVSLKQRRNQAHKSRGKRWRWIQWPWFIRKYPLSEYLCVYAVEDILIWKRVSTE